MDIDIQFANEMVQTIAAQPVVANAGHAPLEGGADPAFGTVRWRTLFCADKTSTAGMVMASAAVRRSFFMGGVSSGWDEKGANDRDMDLCVPDRKSSGGASRPHARSHPRRGG